jgi:patatin-related protein
MDRTNDPAARPVRHLPLFRMLPAHSGWGSFRVREKELRIALVCFGGVSLAVYMHGISKEILKLVRASAALHKITDRAARAKTSFFDAADPADPEYDTEAIYFDLLREIGARVELRVVVDIIAGASAGGINGTMLARALSHDLPMGGLRDLWLENADVSVLLAPEAKANRWSKAFLKPLIWGAGKTGVLGVRDREVRDKLSLFVRSRWFKPPLSGARMAELMFDAVTAMGAPLRPGASLLPSGQRLDLIVMLTDYHGYQHLIQIHDPPLIRDREHHHVLRFACRRNGKSAESDFTLSNAPALAFAARATSSFPGAFPPARIREMDALVERRGTDWPDRAQFIARNFAAHVQAEIDPVAASFIDGSVLNNRPFHEAIAAIHGRPAYRQVDRRLVYIDPDPASAAEKARREVPGFFATLKGAMSDIPRNQPVTDELGWVFAFNDEVRQLNGIIDGARPSIHRLLARIIAEPLDRPADADQIRAWRERANAHVAQDAGFAYQGYVRLKLASVRRFVARLIAEMRDAPPRSPLARLIGEIVDAWAVDARLVYSERESHPAGRAATAPIPDWASFLLAFDVDYRKRRLNFLIEGQNRLYQMIEHPRFKGLDPAVIDRLKRDFYHCLETVQRREEVRFFDAETRALAAEIFAAVPSAADARDLRRYARHFVEANAARVGALVARLAARIDLNASTRDLDVLLAGLDPARWPAEARREVLINYLGFPFWDVLTFPLTSTREVGELHEILVDRISPQDARTLEGFNGAHSLKGIGFGHFAAFLSRAYRENDYLLGRLHAIDRLIDIVCDSARIDAAHEGIDVSALKQRAFTRVLDAEAPHLTESAELIAALRRRVAEMGMAEDAGTRSADPEPAPDGLPERTAATG